MKYIFLATWQIQLFYPQYQAMILICEMSKNIKKNMLAKSAGQTNFLICHLWKITIRDMPSWKFKRHLRSVRFKLISLKIPIANLGIVYAPWLPRKEQGFLQTIFWANPGHQYRIIETNWRGDLDAMKQVVYCECWNHCDVLGLACRYDSRIQRYPNIRHLDVDRNTWYFDRLTPKWTSFPIDWKRKFTSLWWNVFFRKFGNSMC